MISTVRFVVVVVVAVVVATLLLSASCDRPELRPPPIYCPKLSRLGATCPPQPAVIDQ